MLYGRDLKICRYGGNVKGRSCWCWRPFTRLIILAICEELYCWQLVVEFDDDEWSLLVIIGNATLPFAACLQQLYYCTRSGFGVPGFLIVYCCFQMRREIVIFLDEVSLCRSWWCDATTLLVIIGKFHATVCCLFLQQSYIVYVVFTFPGLLIVALTLLVERQNCLLSWM